MSPRNATEIGRRRSYVFRGKKYPSVTTLLKAYPQEWAIAYGAKHTAERVFTAEFARRWSEFQNADEDASGQRIDLTSWLKRAPMERRDAAGDAGTDLHGYLESRLRGGPVADLSPAQRAIEQFLAIYRPEPLFVESQVVSLGYDYAGSFDAIVSIYGKRYLLDLKTSGTYDPLAERVSDAGGDHKDRLQLAAYRYADIVFEDDRELGPVPEVDGALILAVPRDHPDAWRPIEVSAGPAEHRVFLRFADAWRWYDEQKKQAIGEQLLPQTEEVA